MMMPLAWSVLVGIIAGCALLALLALAVLPGKSPAQGVQITAAPYIKLEHGRETVQLPSATLTIPIAPYNDGTDLGRAMAICQQHRDWYSPQSILEPILYQQEWDACRTIHDKWGRSEAAKRFREQLEQEKLDKAFVETIANSGD